MHVKESNPIVQYQQHDKRICLYASFASCMAFLGHKHLAHIVYQNAERAGQSVNNVEKLIDIVYKNGPKRWKKIKKYKQNQLDVLNNISQNPTIVVLVTSTGGTEHAVTILSRWIFDSNLKHALELTKENLNWCCDGIFRAIQIGVRFGG